MYQDNDNSTLIVDELKTCTTALDLMNIIYREFPDWITSVVPTYSDDYPSLKKNWFDVIVETNKKSSLQTTPQAILLVSHLQFGTNYITLTTICELLTIMGYVVRRNTEFVVCSVCLKAIPCEQLYNKLKQFNKPRPSVWNVLCTSCQ